jgi:hypothetical protein
MILTNISNTDEHTVIHNVEISQKIGVSLGLNYNGDLKTGNCSRDGTDVAQALHVHLITPKTLTKGKQKNRK